MIFDPAGAIMSWIEDSKDDFDFWALTFTCIGILVIFGYFVAGFWTGLSFDVPVNNPILLISLRIFIAVLFSIFFAILGLFKIAILCIGLAIVFLASVYILILLFWPFLLFLRVVMEELRNFIHIMVIRVILWLSGTKPLNISCFLNNCTEHLILQRVGNRYRFIHRLVQEHFANLEILDNYSKPSR